MMFNLLITENFFVPDLISLQIQLEYDPENSDLADVLESTVNFMNNRYDRVMEIQFYMVMYSEGAMTMTDIDNMVIPERDVFLHKLREVQRGREDAQKKLAKGG